MIRFLVNRPIAVLMSFIVIILLGIIVSQKVPISLLPDANIPRLLIVIDNPEEAPEDFDIEVVQKIRNNILQVKGVNEMNSYSDTTKGSVELILEYGADVDLAFFEINEKIDEILPQLSYDIKRPRVIKSNLSDIPSLYMSVSLKNDANESFTELSSFVEEKLKTRLEQSKEISFVDITGVSSRLIHVSINEGLINSLDLTLIDIKNALREANFSIGNVEISKGHFVYDLSLENTISSISDIENVNLSVENKNIKLSDIAKISSVEISKNEYFHDLHKAISLAIIKNPKYKTSEFITALDTIVEDVIRQNPQIVISKTKDQTVILQDTLKSLSTSLMLGIFFAIIITLFFLKSYKNVILIIITVVSSLFIDVFLFYVLDISINLISISGLILGIGFMIDNIIIVLDTIEQKISIENDVNEGSIQGVNEIITALMSSAMTTCSIFIPLIFLSGLAGLLFYDQAISVTIALISSFFVSIFLLPTLYVLLNKNSQNKTLKTPLSNIYEKLFQIIEKNSMISFLCIAAIVISGFLVFKFIKKEQLPLLKSSELVFKIEWNRNYRNQELYAISQEMIAPFKNKILSSEIYLNEQSFFSKTQRNNIKDYETYYSLKLKNFEEMETIKKRILSELNTKHVSSTIRFLPEENALNSILVAEEYNVKIISYDKEITSGVIKTALLKKYPDLITNTVGESQRILLFIDDQKLSSYNIEKNEFITFIKLRLGKEKLMEINYGKKYIPVAFSTSEESLSSLLNSLYILGEGVQYTVSDLVKIKYVNYKKGIEADIGGVADILYVKSEKPELIVNTTKNIFPNSSIDFKGSYTLIQQLQKDILYIIIITILLLYLILAIQFESLKLPFIILMEIPIGIAVSLITLYFSNQTLNVMSFIGIIIMCGIVINDSILKIDLIRKLSDQGLNINEAIHSAGKRRLNAIVMTSLTTLLAITPVLFQNDISTQLQAPLIISLIGGLLVGTFVSIFIIPILYKKLM